MTPRRVAIVPHTHWDREWYEPFQTFRLQLVDLLDTLLPLMERDPSYQRFLLDGQMAVVDDYLEVRPEAEDRIRALAASGRLTMGPWYILMDEFLVSSETIVRNLQKGIAKGAAFGGVMDVGYLPDMFGHVAQMPQILNQAGFSTTALWRGVPSEIDKTGFNWEAPDGSCVRAEFLPVGYGNGATLPDDAKALIQRAQAHVEEIGSFLLGDLLWMNGSDHLSPQAHLGRVVAEANALQDDFLFEITSLDAYLATQPREGLTTWKGELRSGYRSNILMGVLSNRIDVKRASAKTTAELERRAEPLAALFATPGFWPTRLFDIAWQEMIRNSAHDSICACSVDEVVDAVLGRFAEARQIASGVATRALRSFATTLAEPGTYVVNGSQFTRSGVVEVVIAGDEIGDDAVQVISERTALPSFMPVDGQMVLSILSMIQGSKLDNDTWIHDATVDTTTEPISLTVTLGATERKNARIDGAKRELYTFVGANPSRPVNVNLIQPRIRRVLTKVAAVPGYGWAKLQPIAPAQPATLQEVDGALTLSNASLTVVIDATSGTFSINGTAGFGRLVDDGDLGDSYNYSPPRTDAVIDTPTTVTVSAVDQGPLRVSATIESTYTWPDHIDGALQTRVGEQTVTIRTLLSLYADEEAVRVHHEFVNPSQDHRLRVHVPLCEPASGSVAECVFGSVSRGLIAEGRAEEFGLPTFPSRRFVKAGGLTIVHEGIHEYELVDIDDDGAHGIALTLLRATGMLSRLGMKYRPFPAGPLTPVEGLQMVGKTITSDYAIAVGEIDPVALADDLFTPIETVESLGGGTRPALGSALEVTGATVSSVTRVDGGLEVRVYNDTDVTAQVAFGTTAGWQVDLRGHPLEPFEGGFALRPRGFATVRITGS